ncbi:MAG: FHA domain-containing protein, partial [Candidatus Eremiobacteraeota bacterium]|nr:FHA domain-containing protein [Candidatus Eremiobacteraeota bacterium]
MKAISLGALGRQAERLFRVARGQAEPTQAPAEKFSAQPLAGQASDGTRFEVPGDGTPITLGSHPDRDVRLSDRFVSRRHAALKLENGQLQVRDLGSSNGTFVDGHKLEPDQWVALPAGARLGLATGVPGQGVELSLGQSEARALPDQLLDNFGIGADHTILRRNLGSYLDRIAPEQRQLLVDQPNAKGLEQLFNQGFTAAEPEQFSAILKIQKALEEPYSNQDVGKRLDSLQDQAKARLRDYETQNGALPARIWLVGSAAKGTF